MFFNCRTSRGHGHQERYRNGLETRADGCSAARCVIRQEGPVGEFILLDDVRVILLGGPNLCRNTNGTPVPSRNMPAISRAVPAMVSGSVNVSSLLAVSGSPLQLV